jgi:hypothetical protein
MSEVSTFSGDRRAGITRDLRFKGASAKIRREK